MLARPANGSTDQHPEIAVKHHHAARARARVHHLGESPARFAAAANHVRPHVGPLGMQNSGPTGSSARALSHDPSGPLPSSPSLRGGARPCRGGRAALGGAGREPRRGPAPRGCEVPRARTRRSTRADRSPWTPSPAYRMTATISDGQLAPAQCCPLCPGKFSRTRRRRSAGRCRNHTAWDPNVPCARPSRVLQFGNLGQGLLACVWEHSSVDAGKGWPA
jgi:hypothetical protein